MKKLNLIINLAITGTILFILTGIASAANSLDAADCDPTDAVYVDDYGNVGIGTTDPSEKLEIRESSINDGGTTKLRIRNSATNVSSMVNLVAGNIDNDEPYFAIETRENSYPWDILERVRIDHNGKVGIGTTNPQQLLHIHNSDSSNYSPAVTLYTNVDSGATNNDGFYVGMSSYGVGNAWIWNRENASIFFGTNAQYRMTILGNGNVGIGTTTPDYILDVNGTIRAKEVLVATGWSDFVFDSNYTLQSLAQVESYIEENKHLPDIPSAKEIQENGLSMAEMMTKQMQKIEELTLYVIEQNKQINELKDELAELKKTN